MANEEYELSVKARIKKDHPSANRFIGYQLMPDGTRALTYAAKFPAFTPEGEPAYPVSCSLDLRKQLSEVEYKAIDELFARLDDVALASKGCKAAVKKPDKGA